MMQSKNHSSQWTCLKTLFHVTNLKRLSHSVILIKKACWICFSTQTLSYAAQFNEWVDIDIELDTNRKCLISSTLWKHRFEGSYPQWSIILRVFRIPDHNSSIDRSGHNSLQKMSLRWVVVDCRGSKRRHVFFPNRHTLPTIDSHP